MINKEKIESLITGFGFMDYRWINPQDFVVSQWVKDVFFDVRIIHEKMDKLAHVES